MINKLIAINSGLNRFPGQNKVSSLANIAIEISSLKFAKESKLDSWTYLVNEMDRGALYLTMFFETNGERRDQILSYMETHRRYDADIKILKNASFNDKNQAVQTHARKVYAGHVDKGMLSDEYTDLQIIADSAIHLKNLSSEKVNLYNKEEKTELLTKYTNCVKNILKVKGGRGYLYMLLTLETNSDFRNTLIDLLKETSKPATQSQDIKILQHLALSDQSEATRQKAMNTLINYNATGIDIVIDLVSSKEPKARLAYAMVLNTILENPDSALPRLYIRLKDSDERKEIEESQLMRGLISSFTTNGQTDKVVKYAIYALNDHYLNNENNLYVANELWTVIQRSIDPSTINDNYEYLGISTRPTSAETILNTLNRDDIKFNSYVTRRIFESLNSVVNEDDFDNISKLILNKKLANHIRVGAAHLLYKMKNNKQAAHTLETAIENTEPEMKNKLKSLFN